MAKNDNKPRTPTEDDGLSSLVLVAALGDDGRTYQTRVESWHETTTDAGIAASDVLTRAAAERWPGETTVYVLRLIQIGTHRRGAR